MHIHFEKTFSKNIRRLHNVAQEDDELTVVTGEKVTIQKKFCDGWWLVKRGNFVADH